MMSVGVSVLNRPLVACAASQKETVLFLTLPVELRNAIYRYCIVENAGSVKVESNYLVTQLAAKISFYTLHDLSLLEVNRQVRAEASEVFYAENVFTLKSYRRTQEHGQKPFYGHKSYHIDYGRVRKAHVLTPNGFAPESLRSCIQGGERMQSFLEGIADALANGHCMKYMLIESYEFERVPFDPIRSTTPWELGHILKPLEKVRGLELCHIRAMRMSLWPYLRFLEGGMTKSCSDPPKPDDGQRPLAERALLCKEIMSRAGVVNAFGDPDFPHRHKIYEIFQTKPLYKEINFLAKIEEDVLNRSE